MKNGIIIIPLLISLIITAIGYGLRYFRPENETGEFIMNISPGISVAFGLALIFTTSTIFKTKFFTVMLVCILFCAIAATQISEHPTLSKIGFTVSLCGLSLAYGIRFVLKEEKKWLDILKLIWISSIAISYILVKVLGLPKEINFISTGFFWLTVATVAYFDLTSKKEEVQPNH